MSVVNKNQPNFFGNDGLALKNGYIYIGELSKDPVTFPKTVTFTDSTGNSFTAPQPLRTNIDGQITYNGKSIFAAVDGDHSMLIKDQNDVQIRGGWVPNILASTSGGGVSDLSKYRIYEPTLSTVKQLDVSLGQSVGNLGRITANDTLGESWIVVSATGSPADDLLIIDFTNGYQGLRVNNYLKPSNNLLDLSNKATSRTNLDVYSKAESNAAFLEDGVGAVSDTNLATDSVSTIKIQASSVTGAKLDNTGSAEKMGVLLTAGTITGGSLVDTFTTAATAYDAYTYLVGGDRQSTGSYSFVVFAAGTVTLSFDYRTSIAGRAADFRILQNGNVIEEFSTTTATDQTKTRNLVGLLPGDCITIQAKEDGGLANSAVFLNIFAKASKMFICKDLVGVI